MCNAVTLVWGLLRFTPVITNIEVLVYISHEVCRAGLTLAPEGSGSLAKLH